MAALISFGLCAFVAATILSEFWKGSRAIQAKERLSLPRSAFELTWRNTRRYGGYLVHMGIVFMFIGFTGSAFNQHETRNLGVGQNHSVRWLRSQTAECSQQRQRIIIRPAIATVQISRNGKVSEAIGSLKSASTRPVSSRCHWWASAAASIRISTSITPAFSPDNSKAIFQFYSVPSGLLHLGRILGAALRNGSLLDSWKSALALCAHGGSRHCNNARDGTVLNWSPLSSL